MQDGERRARLRDAPQAQRPWEPYGEDDDDDLVAETNPDDGSPCSVGNPVQVATGNKILEEVDFAAHDLALTRTYSASWGSTGLFGPKWLSGFDYRLMFSGQAPYQSIAVWRPDGLSYTYEWNAQTSRWEDSKPESIAYIEQTGSNFTHYTENHRIEVYNATGRVTSIQDIRGIGLTFSYNGSNQLTTVTHTSGRAIPSPGQAAASVRRPRLTGASTATPIPAAT